jgi:hypothetical protein
MSRIEELKKQNPKLNFNIVDIINKIIPKPKYTELMVNLIKRKAEDNHSRKDIISALESYEVYLNYDEFSNLELLILFKVFDSYIGTSDLSTMKKFIELNERNLIANNNLSTYKSFEDLGLQISLSELKLIDKDIEKQVIKLYESSDWLVLKPLSWNSSRKYGANTKWCTSSEHEPDYFYKYAKRGILIFAIDKLTGNKVAGYYQISDYEDRELSFWNIIDKRIDSMEANLPYEIMTIFRNEFNKEDKVSNWALLSQEDQEKQENWLHMNNYKRMIRYDDVVEPPIQLSDENELRLINQELTLQYEDEVRIVPMRG